MKIFGYEIRKVSNENITYNPLSFTFGSLVGNNNPMSLPIVYRCVDLISSQSSLLPIEVMVNGEKDEYNHLKQLFDNHYLGKTNLIKTIVQQVITKGNSYVYIERKATTPTKLILLNPSQVVVEFNEKTQEIRYKCSLISNKPIEAVNVLHFKLFSYDGIKGVSILQVGKNTIDTSLITEQKAQDLFKNGTQGILTANQGLTAQQRLELQKTYITQFNKESLVVLPASLNFQRLDNTNEELQTNETRNFNVQTICRLFGVNPALLGLDGGANTYSNTEALYIHFIQFTLLPYITMIEEQLNTKLLTPSERKTTNINLNEKVLMKSDKRTIGELHQKYLMNGVMSINEVREELNLRPIEGGDKHIIAYTDIEQNTINKDNE